MSARAIGALAGLAAALLFTGPAFAKPCQCEVAVGCPRDDGHTTLVDFDSIASYRELERHKQSRCSAACAQRSSAEAAAIRADGDKWCDKLGLGHHPVRAYSVVGHTDTANNWCDPDDHIGTLVCEMVCECPPGFSYDPDSKLCLGTCGGRPVAAFNTGCDMQARWQ